VTSPYLIAGFEAFKSKDVQFIRPVSVNATLAMNSAGNFLIEDAAVTIRPMSQHPNLSFSANNPVVNINSNISQNHPYLALGGTISDPNIIQEGPINAIGDSLNMIVVNANNPHITVMGGYTQAPDYIPGSALQGAVGVNATGLDMIVDGLRVVGKARYEITGSGYRNINIQNGVARNCIADSISAPLIQNCMTNKEYGGAGDLPPPPTPAATPRKNGDLAPLPTTPQSSPLPPPAPTSPSSSPLQKLITFHGSPRIYLVEGTKTRWIPSPAVFNALNLDWKKIEALPASESGNYKRTRLIKARGDARVYYITEAGKKKWIPNEKVFDSYQNHWEDIVEVDAAEVAALPSVDLIRQDQDSKVYKIEGTQRRWIQTYQAFVREGYRMEDVAPVNATELAEWPEGQTIE
jgi:hypothetical protein